MTLPMSLSMPSRPGEFHPEPLIEPDWRDRWHTTKLVRFVGATFLPAARAKLLAQPIPRAC
jgi:hypothetical protein